MREDAAVELFNSWFRSEMLVNPLVERLRDSNPRVRMLAIEILASIGNRPAVDALLAKTADRDDLPIIVRTSVKTKDERWLEMLVHQLDDDDSKIRTFAAAAIGRFGSEKGVTALVKHLNDHSPEVRVAIVDALTMLGSKESLAALRTALGDPELDVRIHAVRAVTRIER